MKRYPLTTLLEMTGISQNKIRLNLNISGTAWTRYLERGMPEATADRVACFCGLLPFLVWPDWLDDVGKPCEECGTKFVPLRSNTRFCSERCQKRKAARVRYHNNPDYRARQLEQRRRYYQECRDYVKSRNNSYYWQNRDQVLAQQAEYDRANYDPEKRRARYLANKEHELARQRDYDRRKRAERAA